MRINGHSLKIDGGTLTYRGKEHSLAGARAQCSEARRGIPLVSRRSVFTVTVEGRDFDIRGRASVWFPAFGSRSRIQAAVSAINTEAKRA